MASAIIHLAVAKKLLEKIHVENEYDYYLGSIAPDIAKQIGESKDKSHFVINTKEDIPNIKLFIKRYPTFLYNSFNLGYFTHLYTDKIWYEEILPKFKSFSSLKLLDGTILNLDEEEMKSIIYSDYTNINTKIIEKYDLDLSLFYNDFIEPKTTLKEIPINELDILINKMGIIIENSKQKKTYTFDEYLIYDFIEDVKDRIIDEIYKYQKD